ncbi:MAG TPA: ImmA/IrrE family metallo-endopeptidase [Bryobacteraceae bacterium]|nr:ImmA/IrrE family metallo-endopeptidase [Bryobacteraceae bacterium]HPT24803.1 ImmA/IrrE family metallo-endopeptidase [Bryobacteraceae bacterium]
MTGRSDLSGEEGVRALLDSLLESSRLYRSSADYKALLDFVARMPNFAPFNAMLLQIQKPGLSFAASQYDWYRLFGRRVNEGTRPLLILWPFGPVALVYDVMDTEGRELPRDVRTFYARGVIDKQRIEGFWEPLWKKGIEVCWMDAGDKSAGSIRVVQRSSDKKVATQYRMMINANHEPAVKFTTLAHELAHLFLGHLGLDEKLSVPDRRKADHRQRELEAESVAYIVCARNGVTSASETYLVDYVQKNTSVDQVDVYQVMRAAGQIESLLGLGSHAKFLG